jgi:hypothetical protein
MSFIFDTYDECVRFAKNNRVTIEICDYKDTQYIVTIIAA